MLSSSFRIPEPRCRHLNACATSYPRRCGGRSDIRLRNFARNDRGRLGGSSCRDQVGGNAVIVSESCGRWVLMLFLLNIRTPDREASLGATAALAGAGTRRAKMTLLSSDDRVFAIGFRSSTYLVTGQKVERPSNHTPTHPPSHLRHSSCCLSCRADNRQ